MLKTLTAASALALAVAFGGAAEAQTSGLAQGWNKVQPTNCLFIPGTPAAGSTAAQPDTVSIYVNVVEEAAPGGPPPVPDTANFTTSDPIAINLVAPFCDNGSAFYVYMQGNTPQYFSIYPHLM